MSHCSFMFCIPASLDEKISIKVGHLICLAMLNLSSQAMFRISGNKTIPII